MVGSLFGQVHLADKTVINLNGLRPLLAAPLAVQRHRLMHDDFLHKLTQQRRRPLALFRIIFS